MKKNYQTWCGLPLIILLTALIIYSCKKNNVQEIAGTTAFNNINLTKLQRLYNQYTRPFVTRKYSTKSLLDTSKLNFILNLNVSWDKPYVFNRTDSNQVTEFSMKTDSGLFTLTQLQNDQPVNYRNKTSLIFVNNPSKPHGKQLGFFMKVIEDLNSKSIGSVIDQVHYGRVPQEFSGMVLYFTLGKVYINGYVYRNGKVVRQVTLNNGNNTANTYRPQTVKTNSTSCEVVNVYKNYCEWGGTADDPYQNFHGCTQTFVGVAVTCVTTTSDDGFVVGEGSGGGGGGGTGNDSSDDSGCPVTNGNSNGSQEPSAIIYDDSNPCPTVKTTTYQKVVDLADALDDNPSFLIDCETAKRFKALASFTPPQVVTNRLNNLNYNSSHPTLFSNPYFVQKIQNAVGYEINLDRFEINVNKLPTIDNQELNANQFLSYLRLHINSFINNDIAVFQPYVDPNDNLNDARLWQSNNPIGSIMHLDMTDDGSIMVTDYGNDHWTVATLRTPVDGAHPVSGNRQWGYNTNANGSYTFYVTGVDRLTTSRQEITQYLTGIPFDKADELWESFQVKTSNFINGHSGIASVGSQTKERPNYTSVKAYFDGAITLDQLKAIKGCI